MINHKLKKITTAIIVAIVSSSCQANVFRKAQQAKTKAIAEEKSQPNIVYGDLIFKEQSDYVMIPVSIKDNNQNRGSYLDSSAYSEKEIQLYNIIFFNKINGEKNLLLKKKAIITSFDLLEKKEAGKPSTRFWLYNLSSG